MRAPARGAGGVALALVALLASGCASEAPRTSRALLQRNLSKAFTRAYEAHSRMMTGRAAVDIDPRTPDDLVVEIASRCPRSASEPLDDRPWRWTCEVRFADRDGKRGAATYRVAVDPRGCLLARSQDFPPQVFERILLRPGPNPLVRLIYCP